MPVVDASIVVDWVAADSDPEGEANTLLRSLANDNAPVVAPRLLLEEVANALLTGCRRGRWDGQAADRAFAMLGRLPVSLLDNRDTLERASELSRRYDDHPVCTTWCTSRLPSSWASRCSPPTSRC